LKQLITKPKSKSTTITNKLILLWSRCENNYDYEYPDLDSIDTNENNINDKKDENITWITLEPKTDKKFFSGRNLENVITILQYDPLALSCFVTRDLDKIIISKKKKKGGAQ
jgi:hypothetical protein